MHVSLVYRWLIGTRVIFFWSFGDVVLAFCIWKVPMYTGLSNLCDTTNWPHLWNPLLFGACRSLPWDPTFASCCPDLISHLEQMGLGGRSPGSPLNKPTKQWTHPVFPSKYSTCEYMDHQDAEFAMAMLDYRRVHRMAEIVFDGTGFNKHLALSPKGLLFGRTMNMYCNICVDGKR